MSWKRSLATIVFSSSIARRSKPLSNLTILSEISMASKRMKRLVAQIQKDVNQAAELSRKSKEIRHNNQILLREIKVEKNPKRRAGLIASYVIGRTEYNVIRKEALALVDKVEKIGRMCERVLTRRPLQKESSPNPNA